MQTKLTEMGVKEGSKKGVKETPLSVDVPLTTSINNSINWHKSHRYLFVFEYQGPQPTRGSDKLARVGRYKTIPQARFNYNEDKAIIFTLPRTLKVWIRHPDGIKTKQQLIAAHLVAREVAQSFARKHGIKLTTERTPGFSEHTVENKPLDRLVRPIVLKEPELAKEKLGLSINQTSHRDKVEFTGTSAKERVMFLEYMLDGALSKDLLEIKDTLHELVRYSKKPAERPGLNDYR